MKCSDCSKCVVDPDTGSPVCTVSGKFIYDDTDTQCEQTEKETE